MKTPSHTLLLVPVVKNIVALVVVVVHNCTLFTIPNSLKIDESNYQKKILKVPIFRCQLHDKTKQEFTASARKHGDDKCGAFTPMLFDDFKRYATTLVKTCRIMH